MAARRISHQIDYEDCAAADLSVDERALCAAATEATRLAYAPYSAFRVGAAARLAGGTLVRAANLENGAYPQCLCAEATLLGACHTQHHDARIEAIAVAVDSGRSDQGVAAPCGSCRQQLFEAERRMDAPIRVYLVKADGGAYRFANVSDLLPLGFVLR